MKLISSSPFLCLFLVPALVVSPLPAQSIAAATPVVTDPAPPAQSSALDNTDLQLRVVGGPATEAKVNSTLAKGLSIAVTTASGAPAADVAVALRLPDNGATGAFPDGSHAAVAYTDSTGQAHFAQLHWDKLPGPVAIRITATKGTSHTALLLDETLTSDVTTVVQVPSAPPQTVQPVQQPGQPATSQPMAKTGASPVVLAPTSPTATVAKPEPTVSVTGASPDASQHSSKTKWIIIAAVVAAAAGAGIAVAGKGKSSSAPASNSITVGTPSVSVGAP